MEQPSPSEQKKLDLILETLEENLVPFDTIARFVYQKLSGGESPDGIPCPPSEVVRGAMLLHIQNLMKVIDICNGKI